MPACGRRDAPRCLSGLRSRDSTMNTPPSTVSREIFGVREARDVWPRTRGSNSDGHVWSRREASTCEL